MLGYSVREEQAKSYYEKGIIRVATTPEPEGQKFPCGVRVHIANNLDNLYAGFDATVGYVYAHAYGGNDVTSYSLIVDGRGSAAWYKEEWLSPIAV